MAQKYYSASVTIGGKTFSMDDKVEVRRESRGEFGCNLRELIRPPPLDLSVKVDIPMTIARKELAALLHKEPAGASGETLAKRAAYGGRKGRRALRRLRERATPIEVLMPIDSPFFSRLKVRGKLVMKGAIPGKPAELVIEGRARPVF